MTAEQDALAEVEARLGEHDHDGYCGPGCPDGDRLRAVVESLRLKARNERLVALLKRALPAMEGDEAWLEDNWPNLEAAWTALTADISAALHEEGR